MTEPIEKMMKETVDMAKKKKKKKKWGMEGEGFQDMNIETFKSQ